MKQLFRHSTFFVSNSVCSLKINLLLHLFSQPAMSWHKAGLRCQLCLQLQSQKCLNELVLGNKAHSNNCVGEQPTLKTMKDKGGNKERVAEGKGHSTYVTSGLAA